MSLSSHVSLAFVCTLGCRRLVSSGCGLAEPVSKYPQVEIEVLNFLELGQRNHHLRDRYIGLEFLYIMGSRRSLGKVGVAYRCRNVWDWRI